MKDSVTLYYREGTSDKVYQVSIKSEKGGCMVHFAYGRRGSTMNTGTKTQAPVLYAKAKAIMDKLVAEKKAKGYTEGEDGTPYQELAGEKKHSGIACQLLNPIEEGELEKYIRSADWAMQEKFDGRRMLIDVKPVIGGVAEIIGINRRGMVVALPATILADIGELDLPGDHCLIDGEAVGDMFYAFDLLEVGNSDLRANSYSTRIDRLTELLPEADGGSIQQVATAVTTADKRKMLAALKKAGREGVVIKDMNAPFSPGRPASGGTWLKFKFVKTCSCVVMSQNDKRSVLLGLFCNRLDQHPLSCGNVTIPTNHELPRAGDLVEVQYLYAMPGSNALYQPVYLGPREDVDREDCVLSQLKYKPEE